MVSKLNVVILTITVCISLIISSVVYISYAKEGTPDVNELIENEETQTKPHNFTFNDTYITSVVSHGLSLSAERAILFSDGSFYYFEYYPKEVWFNVTENYTNVSRNEFKALFVFMNLSTEDVIVYNTYKLHICDEELLNDIFHNDSQLEAFICLNDTFSFASETEGWTYNITYVNNSNIYSTMIYVYRPGILVNFDYYYSRISDLIP